MLWTSFCQVLCNFFLTGAQNQKYTRDTQNALGAYGFQNNLTIICVPVCI